MNGILNILKPPGMTSFDIVARVRGLLKEKKCGHSGTLDPMAAGVLPICIGCVTKAIEFMMEKDKLYRAEMTLGAVTDTQDSTGEVLAVESVSCSDEEIIAAIKSFVGKSRQLPPMYSAIKVNGKKLYELAREGLEIDRTPRMIEIFSIDIIDIKRDDRTKILFDVHCSKGTYIRTLCADIGKRLGCGGHMSFLLRKRAGTFDIASSVTLEELKQAADEGNVEALLSDVEHVFDTMKGLCLDRMEEKRFSNGMALLMGSQGEFTEGFIKVYDIEHRFFAIGELYQYKDKIYLKSKKFFII